jgi:hypothetical protein
VAEEPGTTVLSFGGPPTFEPSAWEWAFQAAPLMHTDPQSARQILEEGLVAWPDSPTIHYNLACLEALQGNSAAALVELRRAVALRPGVTEWAREDGDLAALRGDPEFEALVGV